MIFSEVIIAKLKAENKNQAEEIAFISVKQDEILEYYASHYKGDPWREYEAAVVEIKELKAEVERLKEIESNTCALLLTLDARKCTDNYDDAIRQETDINSLANKIKRLCIPPTGNE